MRLWLSHDECHHAKAHRSSQSDGQQREPHLDIEPHLTTSWGRLYLPARRFPTAASCAPSHNGSLYRIEHRKVILRASHRQRAKNITASSSRTAPRRSQDQNFGEPGRGPWSQSRRCNHFAISLTSWNLGNGHVNPFAVTADASVGACFPPVLGWCRRHDSHFVRALCTK